MTSENKRPLPEAIKRGLMDPNRWAPLPHDSFIIAHDFLSTLPDQLREKIDNDLDSMYAQSSGSLVPPTIEELEARLQNNPDTLYVVGMRAEYQIRKYFSRLLE